MRLGIVTMAVATLAALVGVGAGSAATPVTVSLLTCYAHGGFATVPAGSDVTVRLGWSEQTRGRVQSFLGKQATTATLNGSSVANASSLWGAPEAIGNGYVSFWRLSAGTLANAGDTAVIGFQISLSDPIAEGKDPVTGKQIFAGPGDVLPADFGCTITATP
jgi:hypothetical protein